MHSMQVYFYRFQAFPCPPLPLALKMEVRDRESKSRNCQRQKGFLGRTVGGLGLWISFQDFNFHRSPYFPFVATEGTLIFSIMNWKFP